MSVAVLTPIARAPHPEFVTSLIQTLGAFPETKWLHVTGHANTPRVRNLLTHWALTKTDCTDVVFIDDDIAWTPEGFARLVSHDVDVVAGAPQRRSDDTTFCGRLDYPDVQKSCGDLITGQAATAFMRIRRSALDALAPTRRTFSYRDDGEVRAYFDYDIYESPNGETSYVGEDFWFCDECRKNGIEVWIDPHIRLKHFHTIGLDACMADMMRETGYDGSQAGDLVNDEPVFRPHPSST